MNVTPNYQSSLLEKAENGNFALFFSRMTQWNLSGPEPKPEFQSGSRRTGGGTVPVYDSAIVQLGLRGNEILPRAANALQKLHQRQKRLLDYAFSMNAFALEIRARLTSPFISGLGNGHPTETGMILDRNTGMPFISASAVKGVLRLAHSINVLRSERGQQWIRNGAVDTKGRFKPDPNGSHIDLDDREPSLRKYFGDTDPAAADGVRGQFVFLDAFPEKPPTLKTDIMNPHFHKYYGENLPPLDCEDPIPIKFLAVQEGTVFVFRLLTAALPSFQAQTHDEKTYSANGSFGPEDEEHVRNMFSVAFEELGFGAKTSVGYGRFHWLGRGSAGSINGARALPSAAALPTTSTPERESESERGATVEAFKKSLPRSDALAGQIDSLIQTIQAKDDPEIRQICCQLLLDLAKSNKKVFRKAIKTNKPWAVKLVKFASEFKLI